jgi:hypothetical protein
MTTPEDDRHMPTTEQRIVALAALARPTRKGHAVTLDLYVYPDGTSALRAKGITGHRRALRCRDDDALERVVHGVVAAMRNSP